MENVNAIDKKHNEYLCGSRLGFMPGVRAECAHRKYQYRRPMIHTQVLEVCYIERLEI
jgi:hypothetical protein